MSRDDGGEPDDPNSQLLVFVHGFSGDSSDWNAQLAFLSPSFDTHAVDLPGHAGRPAPAVASVASLADSLCDAVESSGKRPLVLIGHSLGCRVILEAYARLRGRLRGMVLIDDHSMAGKDIVRAADHFESVCAAIGFAAMIEPAFAGMFGPGSDPALRDRIVARAKSIDPAFAAALIPDGIRWEAQVPGILATVDVPMLIIQCTNLDEKLNWYFLAPGSKPDWVRQIEAQVPTTRFALVAGAGHFVQIEAADRVNRLIEDFVGSLPATRAEQGSAG